MTGKEETGPSQRAIKAVQEWQYRNSFPATARSSLGAVFMGRWGPKEEETRRCCHKASAHPYNTYYTNELFRHVRSERHVARRFGVTDKDFQLALKVLQVLEALER